MGETGNVQSGNEMLSGERIAFFTCLHMKDDEV